MSLGIQSLLYALQPCPPLSGLLCVSTCWFTGLQSLCPALLFVRGGWLVAPASGPLNLLASSAGCAPGCRSSFAPELRIHLWRDSSSGFSFSPDLLCGSKISLQLIILFYFLFPWQLFLHSGYFIWPVFLTNYLSLSLCMSVSSHQVKRAWDHSHCVWPASPASRGLEHLRYLCWGTQYHPQVWWFGLKGFVQLSI